MALLYKILVVLMSLVGMVASSIMPTGLLVDDPDDGVADVTVRTDNVPLERLVTIGEDGTIGAPVSALWVEVDGDRVTEDVRAHGFYDEVRFKVGVKAADGRVLRIGDQDLALTPTDVVTVRAFTGALLVRGVDTPGMTIQLDGDVQATLVNEAAVKRLQTEGRRDLGDTPANLAYVVLDVGDKRSTVDLAPGGESVTTHRTGNVTVPIPVAWVRVDDRTLKEYAWGEGFVEKIEFLATSTEDAIVVGEERHGLNEDTRVVVKDFVGTYVIFRDDAGNLLLKIEGYAEDVHRVGVEDTSALGLFPRPTALFDYEPKSPTTSDTVTFYDASTSEGETPIILREWSFGDGGISTAETPRHRFTEPGRTYMVSLIVTDANLARSHPYFVNITVGNSPPVAEFDFSPKFPTDIEIVQFSGDKSWDIDGDVVSWQWDFGDGFTSTDANPTHVFADNGTYTVSLTVTDVDGATNSISKVVRVSNVKPSPAFTLVPTNPTVLDTVTFEDRSRDPDGTIESVSWEFGDGIIATGGIATHRFAAVGTHEVQLTVVDDDGDAATVIKTITVTNVPPVADFTILTPPSERTTGEPTCFQDASTDDESRIVTRTWDFGDGRPEGSGTEPCHTFPSTGAYTVNLTVTDRHGASSWKTTSLQVLNGAPIADLFWSPSAPYTQETVTFQESATDPDGNDDIAGYTWWFPHDGRRVSGTDATTVSRSFTDNGLYEVFINVTDVEGHWSNTSRSITITNRAPTSSFTFTPSDPAVDEPVIFHGTVSDRDGSVVEVIWDFGDGTVLRGEPTTGNLTVTHSFTSATTHAVTFTAVDDDGAVPLVLPTRLVDVLPPPPIADFSWTPSVITLGETASFTDTSYGVGTTVVQWEWDFGDGAGSLQRHPTHVFVQRGIYPVTLTVTDDNDPARSGSLTESVEVNAVPLADFVSDTPRLRTDLAFTDTSTDVDGTIVNWTWDFGDGTLSYAENPVHRYDEEGRYLVVLRVRDDDGATSATASTLTITNAGPTPSFTVDPGLPVTGTTTTFTSTSQDIDGGIDTSAWTIRTFGEGPVTVATGSGSLFDHVFTQSGIYTITLTVTDIDGKSAETSRVVRVASDQVKALTFGLSYPDDSGFDFNSGSVHMTLELTNGLTGARTRVDTVVADAAPGWVTIALPPMSWAGDDTLRVSFATATQNRQLGSATIPLDAGTAQTSGVSKVLNMYAVLKATVEAPGPSEGHEMSPGVYTFYDQTERVYVVLTAYWEGSTNPVQGADVTMVVRYTGDRLAVYNVGRATDDTWDLGGLGSPVTRTVDELSTGTDGIVRVAVPYFTPIAEQVTGEETAVPDMYLPGWYATGGHLTIDGAPYHLTVTTHGEFFQDPAGLATLVKETAGIDQSLYIA